MFIATKWNPIYWNTSCLIVNSGSLVEDDDYEEDEDGYVVKKKEKSADYTKIAKALGDIISRDIKISLVDINKSNYSFEPDAENNQILFGMKALSGVGSPIIDQIISGRPFMDFADFMARCPLNKTAMISLIKSGAFDNLEVEWAKELGIEPRILVMIIYLSIVSEPKKKLTLSNFNGLLQKDLVPESLELQKQIFNFNKYLKANKKVGKYYVFDDACEQFYSQHFNADHLCVINGLTCILQTVWDKLYKSSMDVVRDWLAKNQQTLLDELNFMLFKESWDKYAKGSISAWEMDSLCFYYHEHELMQVDTKKYGISDFFQMPAVPEVDYYFERNGKKIPIYKIRRIAGTVIGKNDNKASISLLTTTGIVNVKFTRDYYAMFSRQISETQKDGTKKVMEKGWMVRGTKLLVQGFRRDDTFVVKRYAKTPGHELYKIEDIKDGELVLRHERFGQEED